MLRSVLQLATRLVLAVALSSLGQGQVSAQSPHDHEAPAAGSTAKTGGPTPSPAGAAVYFVDIKNGDSLQTKTILHFGLKGMGVAPAGVSRAHSATTISWSTRSCRRSASLFPTIRSISISAAARQRLKSPSPPANIRCNFSLPTRITFLIAHRSCRTELRSLWLTAITLRRQRGANRPPRMRMCISSIRWTEPAYRKTLWCDLVCRVWELLQLGSIKAIPDITIC